MSKSATNLLCTCYGCCKRSTLASRWVEPESQCTRLDYYNPWPPTCLGLISNVLFIISTTVLSLNKMGGKLDVSYKVIYREEWFLCTIIDRKNFYIKRSGPFSQIASHNHSKVVWTGHFCCRWGQHKWKCQYYNSATITAYTNTH